MFFVTPCNVRDRRQLPFSFFSGFNQPRNFVASVYIQEIHPLHINCRNFLELAENLLLALYIRLELHNFVKSRGRSTGCLLSDAVRTTGFARLCCSRCPRASRRTGGGAPRSTPSTLAYCADITSFALPNCRALWLRLFGQGFPWHLWEARL